MFYLVFVLMAGQIGGPVTMPKAYLTEAACKADALANNARINGARLHGDMVGDSQAIGFACVFQSVH